MAQTPQAVGDLAGLLRAGMSPQVDVCPKATRATRDLLRRRTFLVRQRSHLLAHIHNTNAPYNLPEFGRKIARPCHQEGVAEAFPDPCLGRDSIGRSPEWSGAASGSTWTSSGTSTGRLTNLERFLVRTARTHDPQALMLLQTIHGLGKTLAVVILYEIQDIRRFPRVQDFASYARLVRCPKESAGKRRGSSGRKIGKAHIRRDGIVVRIPSSDGRKALRPPA